MEAEAGFVGEREGIPFINWMCVFCCLLSRLGSIVLKNWKPLDLEKVCDNPVITVGDVLGELTSVVTLRISILRSKPSTFTEIKDKLLKLLILQSHAALRSSGCPLDEVSTCPVV